MTNQEAIKILGYYDVSNLHFYTTDGEEIPFTEWSDAIEMAISALQAQELSKNSPKLDSGNGELATDCISRQAAIDVCNNAIDIWHGMLGEGIVMAIRKKIGKLPSAEPEIIYCQDCIHAIKDGLCGGYWCKGKAVKSSHYCGYAERRTDETD